MSEYEPIACARHEALELAILRGQWLRLSLQDAAAGCELLALPLDMGAADGAEWLQARDADGQVHRLRLDQIRSATPADAAVGKFAAP